MKKKMLLMLLAVAVSVSMIAAATYAWFTDEDDAGKATFTAGTLSVDVSGLKEFYDEEIELLTTIDHMNPGDEFGDIEIEIVNNGTKNLMWLGDLVFETTGDNPLLDAMYISYAKMEHLDKDGGAWLEEAEFINAGEIDPLDFAKAMPAPLTDKGEGSDIDEVVTFRAFDNHKQNGGHGEFAGALIPGNKYKLTLKFAFHESAGNEYQGTEDSSIEPITVGFKVDAYQINEDYYEEIEKTLGTSLGNYLHYTGLIDMQKEALPAK